MALALPKVCSMGGSQTGLVGTVGVALLNPDGTVHTARATAGIYEIGGGCYGKDISFPDNWKGSIKWDTGGGSPVYAVEEYTVDGLVDTVLEDTSELQTNQGNWLTATGFSVPNEYDAVIAALQADLDNPAQYKADVSNLDVAVSTRNATTPPTVGAIRTEMEGVGAKLTAVKDKTDNLPASPAPSNEYDTEMGRIDVVLSTRSSHSAADAADAVWDEALTGASHNIATSAGRRLRQAADALITREETCQAGGANNEVILDAGASAVDDFYLYDIVILESGTGAGQSRHIDSYVGGSKTAILNRDWTTNPDETTNYVLRFDSTKHVHGLEPTARQHVRDAMKLAPAAGAPIAGSVDKHLDDIEADVTGLNGDAMRGTDGAYTGTPPTVDQIADAVLAEVVEGTISMKQALRIMVAALAGISNGAETSSQHFKNLDNTRDRITATMDKGGNRLNIVFDLGD